MDLDRQAQARDPGAAEEWDKDVDAWADLDSAPAAPASVPGVENECRMSEDAFARSRHAPIAAVT